MNALHPASETDPADQGGRTRICHVNDVEAILDGKEPTDPARHCQVNDAIPYRSMGPVTVEEYESRAERYDKQLAQLVGFDPEGKPTAEKMAALRAYREDQYEKLTDAVYKRRGWTADGVPTVETLRQLGIDFAEVVEVVKLHLG